MEQFNWIDNALQTADYYLESERNLLENAVRADGLLNYLHYWSRDTWHSMTNKQASRYTVLRTETSSRLEKLWEANDGLARDLENARDLLNDTGADNWTISVGNLMRRAIDVLKGGERHG